MANLLDINLLDVNSLDKVNLTSWLRETFFLNEIII